MTEPSSKVKASIKYNKNNVKQVKLNLNLKTDADIIEALTASGNMQGYIKDLIRRDLNDDHQKPTLTKKVTEGSFQDGEWIFVEIDNKEFRRKVYYSDRLKELVITIHGNEYAKHEFE